MDPKTGAMIADHQTTDKLVSDAMRADGLLPINEIPPVDQMEALAGYVRDLRHAVEFAPIHDVTTACCCLLNGLAHAGLRESIAREIELLCEPLPAWLRKDDSEFMRNVLLWRVSAVENLLELEASLR